MDRYTRALGAVLIASVISLVPQKNGTSSTPLSVTPANPSLAITRTGTLKVDVNNFPSSQNVGFNNSMQPISFRSTAPLYMRDTPAHNAFAHFSGCTVPAPTNDCSVNITVPSGVELVIETVSVGGALNSGEHAVITMEFTTRGISTNVLTIPLIFAGSFSTESPPDEYAVTQPLHVYADPNTTVVLDASMSDKTGGAGFHFELSGYFVRCSSGGTCSVP